MSTPSLSLRTCAAAASFALWIAAAPAGAVLPADHLKAEVLPSPPHPHWVYAVDIVFGEMTEGKIVLIDGDTRRMLGMISTGMTVGFAPSPDQKELYVTDTFYSRGTRGDRTDVVTIVSTDELKPIAEVPIPPKRFLSLTVPYGTITTPDGRFLLVFNFTPATSVSVVDLKSRKFVGEIATPGCSLAYPAQDSRGFSMLCADGHLLTVRLDDTGASTGQKVSDRRFFDPEKESLNVTPARLGAHYFFISFLGLVHGLDLSGVAPAFDEPWSLLSDADRRAGWRPGGWQESAVNRALNRLYVVMHRGGNGTHKDPGPEVWSYDLATHRRIQRIRMKTPVTGVLTSLDDQPLLYGLGADSSVQVYDARTGTYRGSAKGLLQTSVVLANP
ncbi:MAG: amine dehydrogenase [Proteobacteria bacterium]|nr:amine dehydrogenase [Pseudomonadota bacterium]